MPSLCAVVYRCCRLNEKGQLAPLSVYTFPYLREATKPESAALKLCVCSAGGLEVTEAEHQILFMIPFHRRFILGKLKMRCGLAFDLESASMISWICLTEETDMKTDGWRQQTLDRKTSGRGEKRRRNRKQEGVGEEGREMYQRAGRKRCLQTLGTLFEVCISHSLSEFWC